MKRMSAKEVSPANTCKQTKGVIAPKAAVIDHSLECAAGFQHAMDLFQYLRRVCRMMNDTPTPDKIKRVGFELKVLSVHLYDVCFIQPKYFHSFRGRSDAIVGEVDTSELSRVTRQQLCMAAVTDADLKDILISQIVKVYQSVKWYLFHRQILVRIGKETSVDLFVKFFRELWIRYLIKLTVEPVVPHRISFPPRFICLDPFLTRF